MLGGWIGVMFLGEGLGEWTMMNDSCCVFSSDRGTFCEPFLRMGILSISLLAFFCFLFPRSMTLQSKEKLLKHGVAGGTPAGAKDLWPHLQAPWLVGEVEIHWSILRDIGECMGDPLLSIGSDRNCWQLLTHHDSIMKTLWMPASWGENTHGFRRFRLVQSIGRVQGSWVIWVVSSEVDDSFLDFLRIVVPCGLDPRHSALTHVLWKEWWLYCTAVG